jgi:isopenicillin N synthase-like dioxygenase
MPEAKSKTTLPVLDRRRFDGAAGERSLFLQELRQEAQDFGFFYLSGHGIPENLTQRVVGLARRFFALPEKDKLAIEMVNSPHFRGDNRAGFEHTRGKQDWREQSDIGAERPALPREPGAPAWTRLQGPNCQSPSISPRTFQADL